MFREHKSKKEKLYRDIQGSQFSGADLCSVFKKLVFKGRNENTCRRSVGKILKYGGI